MHRLLRRQIKRHCADGATLPPELAQLFSAIDETYIQADTDRHMLERSLEIVSEEMGEKNRALLSELTERKAAEAKLANTVSTLNATLNSTADGILVVDANRNIESYNRKFLELWGISREMAEEGDDHQLLAFVAAQLKDPEGFVRQVERLSASDAQSFDYLEFADGRIFERYTRTRRIDGVSVGRVWSFRDVSEEHRLQKADQARRVAEAANRAKSEFLSSVSHELRTPLNAIVGYAQLLDLDKQLSAENQEFVGEINRGAMHLLALINDLLELSRIEEGKLKLSPELVNVDEIVSASFSMVGTAAEAHRVTLHRDGGQAPASRVWADRLRLQQALINLLSNGVKYNREGGRVAVTWEPAQLGVRINVTDSGVGIPDRLHHRVFGAFDRLGRETGAVEGSGIGLTITRRIVEAMGGRIGFTSVADEGSTFWIELPGKRID